MEGLGFKARRRNDRVNGFAEYKAIITAGGMGTRMLPFSKEIPKEMFPIVMYNGNHTLELKPVVQAIFEQLHKIGIRDFYVVVGRGKRAIEDHFSPDPGYSAYLKERGRDPKCLSEFYSKIKSSNIVFLNQPEPLGFGDAVRLGEPFVTGTFLVLAGDTFILSDNNDYLGRLAEMHHKYNAIATILLQDVPDPRHYGVVEGKELEDGVIRITSAQEKPGSPKTNQAIMPVYIFTDKIFTALSKISPGVGNELQLTDAIQQLIATRKPVIGVKLRDHELRLDLGSPETMLEALKLSLHYVDAKQSRDHQPENETSETSTSRAI